MMQGEANPPATGELARAAGKVFPLEICKSRAGFFIGTRDEDGAPFSRESAEYWTQRDQAETALTHGHWTQRREP